MLQLTEPVREDFLDFTTAWRIQKEIGTQIEHIRECSSVPKPESPNHRDRMAGPAFLCDCGAVELAWKLLVKQQLTATAESQEGQ